MIFLVIPFLIAELILSLKVIETMGALWSLVWIVGSITVGVILLKNSTNAFVGSLGAVSKGKLDLNNLQNASAAYMLGALLLIVPGILSDIFGIIALCYVLYLSFIAKIRPEKTNFTHKGDEDVIDVEVIDHDHRDDHSVSSKR
jgi:2-isopropylmalate synthase/UPF0716 protein FxsA